MSEQKPEVLLADDETTFRETFRTVLEEEGFAVTAVSDGREALDAITRRSFAVAILDIQMPGSDGISVLREIVALRPQTRTIMVTAYGTVEMAVSAIRLGACDYVMKPVNFDEMLTKIRQHLRYVELESENQKLREELNGRFDISQIIGETRIMKQVFETIRKVAPTRSNVLITGESGTGKELVARAIHSLGLTSAGRFVAINCSAIPETLLESELFGHKRGSFTSAFEEKKGLFETARGGTLFLDEIGHMPMGCQVKLLRRGAAADPPRRLDRPGGCQPPADRRNQPRPAEGDQGGSVPGRLILQDECCRNPSVRPAAATRGYPLADSTLHPEVQCGNGQALHRMQPRCGEDADGS